MRQLFDEILRIVVIDTLNPSDHLCKLYEETGELAQVVNKTSGRKRKNENDTEENIRYHLKEEVADSLQTLFAIAQCYNISYDEIVNALKIKNEKYRLGTLKNELHGR